MVISVDGFRVLFTQDYDWELKEYGFLYIPPKEGQELPKFTYHEGIHNILEISHFGVLLESSSLPHYVDNRDPDNEQLCSQVLQIYPKQTKISIDMPALFVELSIESVFLLNSLLQMFMETQATQLVNF